MKKVFMRVIIFLLSVSGLTSCFLFKDYKQKDFTYTQGGQLHSLPIIVPKGYVKEEARDTTGIRLYSFHYPGGALLYAAYLADTTYELQPFDKSVHQPKPLGVDGLAYKGLDSTELFYREVRQGRFRFGYRNVSAKKETYFDSATNYAALQKR